MLCLNQIRANGWTDNEYPRMYCDNSNEESRSIVCEDNYGDKVIKLLFPKGVTSYFNVEPLAREEFESHDCPRITMTSRDLTWDPNWSVYEDK